MSGPWEPGLSGREPRLPSAAHPCASSLRVGPYAHRDDRFGRMVGRSPAMQTVFDVLGKASSSDATILLEGETGTGKEVSAEAIHRGSPRRDKPFLVVDCGAMPPQLARERAVRSRARRVHGRRVVAPGRVRGGQRRHACSSTRSASSRIDLQPKLLRVLERREVRRVGTNNHVPVNVRLIAATNRSLREQVAAHKFRSDLYYRLAVVEVKLPPLRERLADLPLLVEHIVRNLGPVDEETLAAVRTAAVPGRAGRTHLAGQHSRAAQLPRALRGAARLRAAARRRRRGAGARTRGAVNIGQPLREAREAWVSAFERRYLEELLRLHDNRVSAAARAAGVDRIYFYRLLWKHGLRQREPNLRESDDVA